MNTENYFYQVSVDYMDPEGDYVYQKEHYLVHTSTYTEAIIAIEEYYGEEMSNVGSVYAERIADGYPLKVSEQIMTAIKSEAT